MKKKLLLLGGIILIIIGLLIYIINTKNNSKKLSRFDFVIDESREIDICKNKKDDCESIYIYPQIKHNNENKKLQQIISKLNTQIKDKYDLTINSLIKDSSSCKSAAEKFKYSKVSIFDKYLYENNDYISIAYRIYDKDLCTNKTIAGSPKVYIFSKKKNKIITQSEFQKELNITDEEINNYINSSILANNEVTNKNYSLDYNNKDGKPVKLLFYDAEGILSIYYYQSVDNSYQIATIKKDVN